MAFVPLVPIGAPLGQLADERTLTEQRAALAALEDRLRARRREVEAGWGAAYVERVHKKGKLTARERLARLADPGTRTFETGTFVNYGEVFPGDQRSPAAGVVTAFARVEGRWCMVIANDNTVASGAWWPRTPEKIQRAQMMALRLRLPTIYLVDCSGLFLPEQSKSFPGARGAGHIFKMNSLLSAGGVPQLAGVFGDCIAGGGYMPIISDRVYMTEQAYMVIAGAALIKGAKSQKITSLDIGGPEVHVHQSGCADVRVPDDDTLLACLRRDVARLPIVGRRVLPRRRRADGAAVPRRRARRPPARGSPRGVRRAPGARAARRSVAVLGGDAGGRRGDDLRRRPDRRAVRRPRDQPPGPRRRSRAPRAAAPGGILYRGGIAKISAFSRACNDDGIPLIWLQDISGFDIGREAERTACSRTAARLIYTNSTNTTPMFTVLLRKASGAGYYAMSGLPYDPVIQLSTSLARLSVMEGRTLAIAAFNTKLDDDFQIMTSDPAERAKIAAGMAETEARIEGDMDPFVVRAPARHRRDRRARRAARVPGGARRDGLPGHRLPPGQEPADLVAARSARARRRRAMSARATSSREHTAAAARPASGPGARRARRAGQPGARAVPGGRPGRRPRAPRRRARRARDPRPARHRRRARRRPRRRARRQWR